MFEIKLASSIHIDILCELFIQYREFLQMQPEPKKSRDFLLRRLTQKDSIILIGFYNQQAAGFIQVYPSFSSLAMQTTWTINDLFVSACFRRQGIGRELILSTEKRAQNNHIFSIKLATALDNEIAKRFYASLNYQELNQFSFYSKHLKK